MESIDEEKFKYYQQQASSMSIKFFLVGIIVFLFVIAFIFFYLKESPISKFTTTSTYVLLMLAPVIFAPTARSTNAAIKAKILKEFNKQPSEFKYMYAYGMSSNQEETRSLAKKHYRQQVALSAITGYFLFDTILIVLHLSLGKQP